MKRAQNRSNIDIVRGYLNGERPFIQVGYSPEISEPRREGEIWTDSLGVTWQFVSGVKKQINKKTFLTDIIKFNCKDCGFNIRMLGNKADEKCFYKTNRCYNCEVHHQSELMKSPEYLKKIKRKEFESQRSLALDIKSQLIEALEYLEKNKRITYHNDDGSEEYWDNATRKQKLKLIKTDLKEVAKALDRIENQLLELNN